MGSVDASFFLKKLRAHELSCALRFFSASARVLELGAGSGWQAKLLTEKGYTVFAVDLLEGRTDVGRVFDVIPYDGVNIPFRDCAFDHVFSSNVLEHVVNPQELMMECARVLSGGPAIHVLPSASWRIYTSFAHYIAIIQFLLGRRTTKQNSTDLVRKPFFEKIKVAAFAGRHGERGSEFMEFFHFSKRGWMHFFEAHGWNVVEVSSCNMAYSGYAIFGARLHLRYRKFLAHVLGTSSYVWVVTPKVRNFIL